MSNLELFVSIVVFNNDYDKDRKKVLLVEGGKTGRYVNVPSSTVEKNETPREAAEREMRSLNIPTNDKIHFVGIIDTSTAGRRSLVFLYTITINTKYKTEYNIEQNKEQLKLFWVDKNELGKYRAIWRNQYVDKKIIITDNASEFVYVNNNELKQL